MARRKEHSHEEIRELAISALMSKLVTMSMQQISLRQIANEIGYAPSTLVKVFGSYHFLLLACSGQVLMQLLKKLSLVEGETADTRLLAMAEAYYEYASKHPHFFNLVFELQMETEEQLPESQLALISLLLGKLEKEIAIIVPNLNVVALESASRNFWAGVHGLTLLALKDKLFTHTMDVSQLLQEQVKVFILGVTQEHVLAAEQKLSSSNNGSIPQ